MGSGNRKKRKMEFCLDDLVRFERFISGKNGDFTHDELVELLTHGRLDELMKTATDERKQLLASSYDAALRDPDRLGYIITAVYEEVLDGTRGRLPNGIYDGYQGKLNFKFMLRYAIATKKKWKKSEIPGKIGKNEIRQMKLGRGLDVLFHNSPSETIMFCYPEMALREWYFRCNAENIWYAKDEEGNVKEDGKNKPVVDYEKAAEATREFARLWVAERSEEEVRQALESEKGTEFEGKRINGMPAVLVTRMVAKDFARRILPYGANLKHMLAACFADCPSYAIANAFPGMHFKHHYFMSCPDNYWINKDGTPNMENIADATREFCGIWLKGRDVSALAGMRSEDFNLGLFPGGSTAAGMLQQCLKKGGFKGYVDVIAKAYEGRFRIAECKEVGRQRKLAYAGGR